MLTKSSLGRKRLSWLHFQAPNPSVKQAKAETQGRNLKQRSWRNSHTLLACPSASAQLAFLYSPGPTAQRWHHLQWTEPSPINNQLRPFLTDLSTAQADPGNSSVGAPSSRVTLGCVKLTRKTNQYTHAFHLPGRPSHLGLSAPCFPLPAELGGPLRCSLGS